MKLWRDTPKLLWSVDSDRPLRLIAGWSTGDTDAVELSAWLSKTLPVRVQVVAAVPPPSLWKSAGNSSSKKKRKKLREESDAFAKRVRSTLKSHVDEENWADDPARLLTSSSETSALINAVRDFSADLLVLGSRARQPKGSVFLTSLADTLLAAATVPVLVAPRNQKLSKKGITRVNYVFLGDGGFDHSAGIEHAAHLASRLGVPLRLLGMSPDSPSGSDFDVSVDAPSECAAWYESALSRLDIMRDSVCEFTADSPESPTVEVDVAVGSGWKQATRSVKWKKGDLVCLAFRRKNQLKHVLSGSPTTEFLRHSATPALIFPARAA